MNTEPNSALSTTSRKMAWPTIRTLALRLRLPPFIARRFEDLPDAAGRRLGGDGASEREEAGEDEETDCVGDVERVEDSADAAVVEAAEWT